MNRRNDVSFVIGDKLVVLIEHQSTIDENMPLRLLIYIARVYEKLIDSKAIYRRRMLTIPRPEFIVLYNGNEDIPDKDTKKLSSLFAKAGLEDKALLELEVKVLNVNSGHNKDILGSSKTLGDYAEFIEVVKRETKGINSRDKGALAEAMERAIRECISKGILKDFLVDNSTEVMNMLTEEFDLNVAQQVWLEEGVEIGLLRGELQGKLEVAKNLLAKGYSVYDVADLAGLSLAELKELNQPHLELS
ncbi:Rpn family recombination-promoting nuclease/putative transposase [Deferribacterales bacterium RsTz2092]|nr:hypothetical protein AGMMS49941_01270 [Deferribacterales bacterium]